MRPRYRGANDVLAGLSRQGLSPSGPRVHVDAALLFNQLMALPLEPRVVQDAPACFSIIGDQGIELFHEIATPTFLLEPVEEQYQESIISLTGEQMPDSLAREGVVRTEKYYFPFGRRVVVLSHGSGPSADLGAHCPRGKPVGSSLLASSP